MILGSLVAPMEALGFAAGGLAAVARVLAKHWFPVSWSRKAPLGCGLCMGFWSTVALEILLGLFGYLPFMPFPQAVAVLFGAVGIAAWINVQIVPVPFDLPPDGPKG